MIKSEYIPFPELSTTRFSLRQLTLDDKEEIFVLRSDERVLMYLDIPIANTIEDACQFIIKINNGISNSDWIYWGISKKNESKLLGTICLWNISREESNADIGFALLHEYQGRGIMQEIMPVVLDYGFNIMKLQKIKGEAAPENIKSIKLMEKFGFVNESKLENTVIYSLQKEIN